MTVAPRLPLKLAFGVALIFAAGCVETSQHDRPHQTFRLERLGTIPSSDTSDVDAPIIGGIRALDVDEQGRLYVLDGRFGRVLTYSADGNLIRTFEIVRGDGPGEMASATDFSVDADRIFVLSFESRKVSEFLLDGSFVADRIMDYQPTNLVASEGFLYSTAWWMTSDTILYRHQTGAETRLGLLPRPDEWEEIARTGNFEAIAKTPSGTIVYSYPRPYRLSELSRTGTAIGSASGMPEFTLRTSARRASSGAVILVDRESSRGLAVLDDGRVLNVVRKLGNYMIDVFDANLDFVSRIDSSSIEGEGFSEIIAARSEREIYVGVNALYPSIARYRLVVTE